MLEVGLSIACPSLRTVCYIEREARSAALLVARMEDEALDDAPVWDDAATFDGKPWNGIVDFISAGIPCQPESAAGKRLGDRDARWLWHPVRRIIGEIEPAGIFIENVSNFVNVSYRQIRRDLEGMGFIVAETLVTAQEVGASHIRERLFVLAICPDRLPKISTVADRIMADAAQPRSGRVHAGSRRSGQETPEPNRRSIELLGAFPTIIFAPSPADPRWPELAEQYPIFLPAISTDDHKHILKTFKERAPSIEPAVRRMVDGVVSRVDQLRSAGNGVVPLQAAYAFSALCADLLSHYEGEGT